MTRAPANPNIRMIDGLADIADQFTCYLLDLWGLVHDGRALYPGVADCLKALKTHGKRVIFLSNSPNRAYSVARKLAGLGVPADLYEGIVTGGEMTHHLLRESTNPDVRTIGKRLFDVDGADLSGILRGIPERTQVPDLAVADTLVATVVDAPVEETLSRYDSILESAVKRGLPLLCANPDRIVLVGTNLFVCPGAVADRYESLGGRSVRIGKPYFHVYDRALALLGHPDKARVLAAGDSLTTDVAGARNAGLPVLLNLTGIHVRELYDSAYQDAGLEACSASGPNMAALCALVSTHACHPDYMIAGLRWSPDVS